MVDWHISVSQCAKHHCHHASDGSKLWSIQNNILIQPQFFDAAATEYIQTMQSSAMVDWIDDLVSGCIVCNSAFDNAFSMERCLAAWEKIGALLLLWKCLESKQVRCEFGDFDN